MNDTHENEAIITAIMHEGNCDRAEAEEVLSELCELVRTLFSMTDTKQRQFMKRFRQLVASQQAG